jgi:hypothetical protein
MFGTFVDGKGLLSVSLAPTANKSYASRNKASTTQSSDVKLVKKLFRKFTTSSENAVE